MNSCNFYKVFFQALIIIQETEKDKELRTMQSLKLMEAITILANENKKEFISFLFTGERNVSQYNSRYNQMASQAQKELTTLEMRKQYLSLLSSILIQEDTGLQIQVVEMFKAIFESMKNSEIDEKIVNLLMNNFFSNCFEFYSKMEINNQFINFVVQFLDLFQQAYKLSPAKFRTHVQKNQLIVRLFQRSDCRDKAIHLALIKLVRSLIVSDNVIINHMIAQKIIEKIWEIYKRHERRPNLVNSTFQDMMHYLLVQNYIQTPKLFKYIMNNFGEELKARQNKILCFKKIVETYGQQKDWINQDRNEQLDYQNAEYLQQPHIIMEQIEEEKYFDSDDRPTVESAAPKLNQKQQQEKEKENMLKKQHLKEQIMRSLSKGDDEEENQFQMIQPSKNAGLNNNNTGQSNQGDSISSSSSLLNNLNTMNINGESPLSTSFIQEPSAENQNKLEFSIDLGSDLDDDKNNDSSSDKNSLMEIEEKQFDNDNNITTKKDEELKDDKYNESILNNSSYLNDSKINVKRSFRQREESEQDLSFIDDNQSSEDKNIKTDTKNHDKINQADNNKQEQGNNYKNIYPNIDEDDEQNVIKQHTEVVQKKIKVD